MVGEEDVETQLLLAFPVDKEEPKVLLANRVPVASLVIMVEAVHLIVKNAHEADTNPMKHPVVARAVPMGGTKMKNNNFNANQQVMENIIAIQKTKTGAKLENTQMHNKMVANPVQMDGKE